MWAVWFGKSGGWLPFSLVLHIELGINKTLKFPGVKMMKSCDFYFIMMCWLCWKKGEMDYFVRLLFISPALYIYPFLSVIYKFPCGYEDFKITKFVFHYFFFVIEDQAEWAKLYSCQTVMENEKEMATTSCKQNQKIISKGSTWEYLPSSSI